MKGKLILHSIGINDELNIIAYIYNLAKGCSVGLA